MYIYQRGGNPNALNKYNQTPIAYGANKLLNKLGLQDAHKTGVAVDHSKMENKILLLENEEIQPSFDNHEFFQILLNKDEVSSVQSLNRIPQTINDIKKKTNFTDISTARSMNNQSTFKKSNFN